MDFSDAVMLSGETAVGKYPLQAAQTIQRIAQVTEAYLAQNTHLHPRSTTSDELALTASMSRSVGYIADDINAKLVAVWSQRGSAAQLLSKARIDIPILALSSEPRICRQMCLGYGVIPRCRPIPTDIEAFTHMVDQLILGRHWAQVGDKIILVTGQPIGVSGSTNAIIVHRIADPGLAAETNAAEQDAVLVY
jgi:pyruvate kinase